MSRDIKAVYRDAMVTEYESYKTAGREEDAAHVAAALKDRFDYDVDGSSGPVEKKEPEKELAVPDVPERADAKLPETAAEPKPAQAAKKTAAPRPGR